MDLVEHVFAFSEATEWFGKISYNNNFIVLKDGGMIQHTNYSWEIKTLRNTIVSGEAKSFKDAKYKMAEWAYKASKELGKLSATNLEEGSWLIVLFKDFFIAPTPDGKIEEVRDYLWELKYKGVYFIPTPSFSGRGSLKTAKKDAVKVARLNSKILLNFAKDNGYKGLENEQ